MAVVAAHRLTPHAGLGFDPPIAPSRGQECGNLLLLVHLQVVVHRSGGGRDPSNLSMHPCLPWPHFRCSVVAAFGCLVTQEEAGIVPAAIGDTLQDFDLVVEPFSESCVQRVPALDDDARYIGRQQFREPHQ